MLQGKSWSFHKWNPTTISECHPYETGNTGHMVCEKFSDVWGLASGSLQTSTATPQSQISAFSLLLFSVLQSRVVFMSQVPGLLFSRRWRLKIKVTLLFLSFVCQIWEIDLEQKDHSLTHNVTRVSRFVGMAFRYCGWVPLVEWSWLSL